MHLIKWENLQRVLEDYGRNLVENYQRALADNNIDASGDLSRTATYIVNDDRGSFTISLELNHYWKYVENGRRAGKMPPISAIENWIEIKPVLPRPMANGKLPTIHQLAFLIARKIGEVGIAPRPVLQESIDSNNKVFMRLIEEAIAEDVGGEVDLITREVAL